MGERKLLYCLFIHIGTVPYISFFLYICKNNLYGKAKFTLNHSTNRITNARTTFLLLKKTLSTASSRQCKKRWRFSKCSLIEVENTLSIYQNSWPLKLQLRPERSWKTVKKPIWYDWKNDRGKINDTVTAIISSATKERGTGLFNSWGSGDGSSCPFVHWSGCWWHNPSENYRPEPKIKAF